MAGAAEYVVEQAYPFEGGTDGRSTRAALAAVRLNPLLDLGDELAYPRAELRRVWLVKRPPMTPGGRAWIAVVPAEQGERGAADPGARPPLGTLRPVQRYVRRGALERAGLVLAAVRAHHGEDGDPWGFVRLRRRGAARAVHVTPIVVEQLHPLDWDDADAARDFVVCDGNHRVVQVAWNEERPLAAVAVLGPLPFPYYARPLDRFVWPEVAANVLDAPPADASAKYWPRPVDRSELRRAVDDVSEDGLFRRYYRDLPSGFGSIGGQAGEEA